MISTYELGHQPFGLASPAAWLRAEGWAVTCVDLAVQTIDEPTIKAADLIAVYLPMHTATRLATALITRVRHVNPAAHVCAYGLYAPVNVDLLRELGVHTILGGEFEEPLARLAQMLASAGGPALSTLAPDRLPLISLERLRFRPPDRAGLPPLSTYATLILPDGGQKTVGYTEASRGCKHLCRHCPIVPVYGGRFRVVQRDVVSADVAQLVGGGAEHITFGDPDFFNGPRHAVDVVRALHEQHPWLTYDVTIKIEHIVRHAELLPVLRETGCILVTSAVEAFDPRVLEIFDKGHTRDDFSRAVGLLRAAGLALNPTFVAFTPWTSREHYADFLATIQRLGLVGNVSPVQYAIRLLIPQGSRLLDLPETAVYLDGFDRDGLCYRWVHPDPVMDSLQAQIFELVERAVAESTSRVDVFRRVCRHAGELLGAAGEALRRLDENFDENIDTEPTPTLSEPWYCCAEPVRTQLEPML